MTMDDRSYRDPAHSAGGAAMSGHAIIEVNALTKSIATQAGRLAILHPISLRIVEGQSIAITGTSGSGKSTLLGLLAGLDTPTSGEVILNQQRLSAMDEEGRARVRARNVGFIFQSFQLLPGLNALENVMLPLELRGDRQARERATSYLARVGLAQRLQHYPQQLSGGEQQRVAIARAFTGSPRILFADEPTGSLDQNTGRTIVDLLFELNRDHRTTLVLVTHDERLAARCDRRFVLEAGALVDPLKGADHAGLQTTAA
jgi:putative ABC transport system ATP-binding protein